MGIFSFLSGKKDEATEAVAGAGLAATSTEATETAFAGASADASADTPFHPPEAWNLDALTAPPPAPAAGTVPEIGPMDTAKTAEYQQKIIDVIKTVYDPEIPVDIYELGLIYEIIVDAENRALVRMTLTSPACPSAQQIPQEVRYKVKAIPGVADAWVEIVWEPPWDKERMSEAAKLTLGFF